MMDDQGTDLTRTVAKRKRLGVRLQFLLAALFACALVASVWLAWNVHQVNTRRSLKAYVLTHGGTVVHDASGESAKNIPVSWRLLGVEPIKSIWADGVKDPHRQMQINAYFPEAEVAY